MMHDASTVTRPELLAAVKRGGTTVTPTQLRRWCDVGLMPNPVRRGLGRGRGVVALYPTGAAWQASVIARALKQNRNLDDAGWTAWVLGFPVTAFVRDLLIEELEAEARQLKAVLRALGKPRSRRQLVDAAKPGGALSAAGMGKVLLPESIPTFLQMTAEYRLGQIHERDYTEEEWTRFQEESLSIAYPDLPELLDDEDLPSPIEVKQGINRFSREASIAKVIAALKDADDSTLCTLRAEAQELVSVYARAIGVEEPVMSRAHFQSYFTNTVVDPEGPATRKQLIQIMGWKKPPFTPLQKRILERRKPSAGASHENK